MGWPARTTPFDAECSLEPRIPAPPEPGPDHETRRPVLLVDVDGVLNCFGSLWSEEYEAEHFEPVRLAYDRYSIRCRKGLIGRLELLASAFTMTWATAWSENAHPFFGPWLNLGEPWPHLTWTASWVGEGTTWKLPDVKKYVAEHHPSTPVAWIDDDLQVDAYEWATQRTRDGNPTLLVRTNPCDGLEREHVDVLLHFAHTSRRAA